MRRLNVRILLLAMAGASMGSATSAHAEAFASAVVGPLQIQLVDLDLSDGVAPSITFVPFGFGIETWAQSDAYQSAPTSIDDNRSMTGATLWAPVTAHSNSGIAAASSFVTSQGTAETTVVASVGRSDDPLEGIALFGANASSSSLGGRFVLSANTAVVFSAKGTVSAFSTNDLGYAYTTATLTTTGLGAGPSRFSSDVLSAGIYDFNHVFDVSQTRLLQVSFSNATAADMSGVFKAETSLSGRVSGVPEPASAAMLLVGLVSLAAFSRGRR